MTLSNNAQGQAELKFMALLLMVKITACGVNTSPSLAFLIAVSTSVVFVFMI